MPLHTSRSQTHPRRRLRRRAAFSALDNAVAVVVRALARHHRRRLSPRDRELHEVCFMWDSNCYHLIHTELKMLKMLNVSTSKLHMNSVRLLFFK